MIVDFFYKEKREMNTNLEAFMKYCPLLLVFSLMVFGCQSTNSSSQTEISVVVNESEWQNGDNVVSLAGTEWESNPSLYYRFVDDTAYKFCLFSPTNNPDEGTYTLEGDIVTFYSVKLNKSWTARIEGNQLIRGTGEIYIKRK